MAAGAKDIRATLSPVLRYLDAAAAIHWLCEAFGFHKHMVVPAPISGRLFEVFAANSTRLVQQGMGIHQANQ